VIFTVYIVYYVNIGLQTNEPVYSIPLGSESCLGVTRGLKIERSAAVIAPCHGGRSVVPSKTADATIIRKGTSAAPSSHNITLMEKGKTHSIDL
jgi:hypothetical protein